MHAAMALDLPLTFGMKHNPTGPEPVDVRQVPGYSTVPTAGELLPDSLSVSSMSHRL